MRRSSDVNHCTVDGRRIAYRYTGKNSDAPWIICFSGAASDSFDWYLALHELAKISNVLIVDKPGFLETQAYPRSFPEEDGQQRLADDVYAVCQQLRLPGSQAPIYLLGHSLGYLSALQFFSQFGKCLDVRSVTSLDGVSFNPSSIELMNALSPTDTVIQRAINWVMDLGVIRVSPSDKDYPPAFLAQIPQAERIRIKKLRAARQHNRAVLVECRMTPVWLEGFVQRCNLERLLSEVPQHYLQALQPGKAIGEEPEVKYFPHLRSLIEQELQDRIEWCQRTAVSSGGIYETIDSEHFIQWHFPSEVATFMVRVLEH